MPAFCDGPPAASWVMTSWPWATLPARPSHPWSTWPSARRPSATLLAKSIGTATAVGWPVTGVMRMPATRPPESSSAPPAANDSAIELISMSPLIVVPSPVTRPSSDDTIPSLTHGAAGGVGADRVDRISDPERAGREVGGIEGAADRQQRQVTRLIVTDHASHARDVPCAVTMATDCEPATRR